MTDAFFALITPASIFGSIISSADMLSPSWNESACSICPLSSSAGHNTVGVRAYGDPQRDTCTQARAHAMNPPAARLMATLPPAAPHAAPASRTGDRDVSGNGSGAPTGRGLADDFGKVHPGDARVLVIDTLPPSLWPRCSANKRHVVSGEVRACQFVPNCNSQRWTVWSPGEHSKNGAHGAGTSVGLPAGGSPAPVREDGAAD
jgi:hypothetical protein